MSFLKNLKDNTEFLDMLLDEEDNRCWHPESRQWKVVVEELVKELPLHHSDGSQGEDLIHWRWASAIMCSLYLGSIMEQKKSHGWFSNEHVEKVKKSIEEAFKIGFEDARSRESRKSTLKTA